MSVQATNSRLDKPSPETTLARLHSSSLYLLLALLIAIVAAWPLLAEPGLLNTRGGGDSPFLLQRLHQLTAALGDGHFPVRWMPDANYGYGYPFYNYYAPLSIYIAAVFRFIGFTFVRAIHLAQLAGFLVAAWGMFELGRRWLGSPQAGLLASAAYTLAPFHLVNIYVRGDSLAEFWAMAFYPMALLAADHSRLTPHTARFTPLAFCFAALILSHNISALIFTPFLLFYLGLGLLRSGWRQESRETRGYSLAIAAALALGAALSAWFWLPALGEQKLAQLGPVTEGYFHYSAHFREIGVGDYTDDPDFLIQPSLLFDYDVSDGRAFSMGLVQAVLAAGGLLLLLWPMRDNWRPYLFIAVTLLVATLMMTPWSRPLWDHLPYLPFTQFPWRFLSVQALAAALATGLLATLSHRIWLTVGLIILLLFSSLGNLQTDHLYLADEEITAVKLAEYEWFTGNIGSTISAEYLPPTVQPRPYSSAWLVHGERDQAQFLSGEGTAALQNRRTTRQSWQIAVTRAPATVSLPTMAWTGWTAALDGRSLPVSAAPGSGLITLELPAGTHAVTLILQRTPLRLAAELTSLAALLLVAWVAIAGWLGQGHRESDGLRFNGRLAAIAGLFLFLLLAARCSAPPQFAPGSLNWDFAQMGYLHHAPEGISFSDGRRLVNYSYNQEEIMVGEPLALTMMWENGAGPVVVELVSPAINRFTQAPVFAATQAQITGETIAIDLDLPSHTPPGLYLVRLSLPQATALAPSGQPRGQLFLQPVRITAVTPSADDPLSLMVQPGPAAVRPTLLAAPAAGCWPGELGAAVLELPVNWYTPVSLSHNYNVSLRLLDGRGATLAQCDNQPGYGFLPATSWLPGAWQPDRLVLPLPNLPADSEELSLTIQLYEAGTGQPVLLRRLGDLTYITGQWHFRHHRPHFALPATMTETAVTFDNSIQLRGYRLEETRTEIGLTLTWEAFTGNLPDWTRFVHLRPLAGGEPAAQHDSLPRYNSHPTSQWVRGEVVPDPLWLDLTAVPPGRYQLVVGFYDRLSGERATVVNEVGRLLPEGFWVLPDTITVESE